jgi:hypothetical protein
VSRISFWSSVREKSIALRVTAMLAHPRGDSQACARTQLKLEAATAGCCQKKWLEKKSAQYHQNAQHKENSANQKCIQTVTKLRLARICLFRADEPQPSKMLSRESPESQHSPHYNQR